MIFQKSTNYELHTFDIGTVVSPAYINNSDADIVHLHWVNYSMVGIKAISKINKPIVWTFHDMWPFMGCEHYDDLINPFRYTEAYNRTNKNIKACDINKIAWKLKNKYWKNIKFNVITPSKWLKQCAEKSYIFKSKNIINIPNIIEEDKFYYKEKKEARRELSFNLNKKYILFGAFNTNKSNKGGDLLNSAIKDLEIENTELLIFGSSNSKGKYKLPTKYMGYINDESTLNNLYNAADVFIVPSRQDNLPNTVIESMRCGTPIVAFNIGGMPDMIIHKHNGYLASAFDTDDLKSGIEYIINNPDNIEFKNNCLTHFNNNFSKKVVIPKFIELYNNILEE